MTSPSDPPASSVKFQIVGGAQPLTVVPVQINGTGPFEFILDTGAGTTLVTPEVADRFALPPTGTREGQTAGGKVSVTSSTVDSLQVGRARARNLQVAIRILARLAAQSARSSTAISATTF